MAPFQYDRYRNPYVGSISDILRDRGLIEARRAEQVGNAQANATLQGGQASAGAVGTLAQIAAGIPQQIQQSRRVAAQDELAGLQIQRARGQLADDAALRTGQARVSELMAGDQLPPGDTGPRRESYVDANGLFEIPKLNQALAKMGIGHLAPELLTGAEHINDSITKHRDLELKVAQAHTVLLGDLADGALQLSTKAGTPLLEAMDFVVQPAIATKRVDAKQYAQIRAQIAQLPPEQQTVALTTLVDQAAKLGGDSTLAEGATRIDRYGRTIASGGEKPKTNAELAYDLSSDDPAVRARAKTAIDALHPAPKRTDSEAALDAYAKSIGKTNADALTYADRQVFEKNKATITSNQAFQQHMRERQYDIANPIPVKDKSQDVLEQEGRTLLARGLSSRSGGLGLEDAKVQQANHLLSLLEQSYDPKTDTYHIPKVMQSELALGLARLVSPGGQVGLGLKKELDQATAKGDFNAALTYITGTPFNGTTQAVIQMFKDSIERQGQVALENREGEMRYLRGLMPTGLEDARRKQLESVSLNPLRQSRIIQNPTTGERRLQVSIDGGVTWK